jgi:hypothetical protein
MGATRLFARREAVYWEDGTARRFTYKLTFKPFRTAYGSP